MLKLELVENWNKAHRMFSVWAMSLAGTLQVVWLNLPPDMKAALPPEWVQWVSLAILVLGVIGRIVRQPAVDANGDGFPDTQPLDKTP